MKAALATLFLCILCGGASAQNRLFSEDIVVDDSVSLIGTYAHYDDKKTYEKYNFILTGKEKVDSVLQLLTYGRKKKHLYELDDFLITLVKNHRLIAQMSISPKVSNVLVRGQSYHFDTLLLEKLASKFHFKYRVEKKVFNSQSEFLLYSDSVSKRKDVLFLYPPSGMYDGSFDVRFDKNKMFPDTKRVDEYLRKKVAKIAGNKKFSVIYIFNENNLLNPEQFTMTVNGDYEIFKNFQDDQSIKGKWQPKLYNCLTIIRDN